MVYNNIIIIQGYANFNLCLIIMGPSPKLDINDVVHIYYNDNIRSVSGMLAALKFINYI